MAKSRRRMTKSPGRARRRADWVFRPNIKDSAGALVDAQGSYESVTKSLAAGVANIQTGILYDSYNYWGNPLVGTTTQVVQGARAARAEGRNPLIHRVVGTLFVTPSVWALGNTFQLGIRAGKFLQAPDAASIIVDAEYNLWLSPGDAKDSPANFANTREWQMERRYSETFNASVPSVFTYNFNFAVKRSLKPNECYALYLETATGSVTVNCQFWFRTLVSDEG